MPIKNFFSQKRKDTFDIDKAMQKAVASPDYNENLNRVARETLGMNIEELQHVRELLEQLESNISPYKLPVLMHNAVLLGRNKRHRLIPNLRRLLHSLKTNVNTSRDEELRHDYYYCLKTLKKVEMRDTHPHVMYYDLSNFLTSFFTYTFRMGVMLSKNQLKMLHSLQSLMVDIIRETKDEKEETIRKCRQVIEDTKSL